MLNKQINSILTEATDLAKEIQKHTDIGADVPRYEADRLAELTLKLNTLMLAQIITEEFKKAG